MSGWTIFKAVVKSKKDKLFEKEDKRPLLDTELPLGIRIGSKVSFETTPFVIHSNLLMSAPSGDFIVSAWEEMELSEDTKCHRFFLTSEKESDRNVMLQAVVEKSTVNECKLFDVYDEITPSCDDEWEFWLDDETGAIGRANFGIDPDNGDHVDFYRDGAWADSEEERIYPFEFSGLVRTHSKDDDPSSLSHQMMMYGRHIDEREDMAEYCLLSLDEGAELAVIAIYVGIDISNSGIIVKY